MAGCFGNHWVDRCLEQQLFDHLRKEDEAEETDLEREERELAEMLEWDRLTELGDIDCDTNAFGNCYSDADLGL